MTDIDLDRLGDVWRQQPDPAEMDRLQKTAIAVARRARWNQIIDVVAAFAVSIVMIILVLSNPKPDTVVIGTAAILVALYSNIRLRRLREIELRSLVGGTEDMLDQSIERITTTIKYNKFALVATGPGFVVGILVAAAALGHRDPDAAFGWINGIRALRTTWLTACFAAVGGAFLYIMVTNRRSRRELERLTAMRDSYRQERETGAIE